MLGAGGGLAVTVPPGTHLDAVPALRLQLDIWYGEDRRHVLQLPEPWGEVAEILVMQRSLSRQTVLWEALEEPGGQLLSVVHIAQLVPRLSQLLSAVYCEAIWLEVRQ